MLPDADPNHKDLYVEIDAMAGIVLTDTAVILVEGAFMMAPLSNPDQVDGVTLHVLRDDSDVPHVAVWMTDGCWPLNFDAHRNNWYGTSAEASQPGPDDTARSQGKGVSVLHRRR